MMYFIARNNALYNYIVHISAKRRYALTLGTIGILYCIGVYLFYYPLLTHNVLLSNERNALQRKYEEIIQWEKSTSELLSILTSSHNYIAQYTMTADKQNEYHDKRILFIFDTVKQLDIILNTYGSCKEKDKIWYIKNIAHFDITGPLQQLLIFFKKIKDARMMIVISNATIIQIANDTFQISFDAGLFTVKKEKSPSTLNKLKG